MFDTQQIQKINEYYNTALHRIKTKHIGRFKGHEKEVFLISDTYPGVWLEHVYDSIFIAKLDENFIPIAKNTLDMFIDHQSASGQLPCYVIDKNKDTLGRDEYGYGMLQECVSFARLCLEFYELYPDKQYLEKCFLACEKWANWLKCHRMTQNKGLIELFCGFDDGHDHSPRHNGFKYVYGCPDKKAENFPEGDEVLPLIAPDLNAVFYGTLISLSQMAKILGHYEKISFYANWASDVKKRLYEVCYDENDRFFYDIDKNGKSRKVMSISISNLFCEHIFTQDEADKIYSLHMKNPEEFYTEFPFPSVAKNDAQFIQNTAGNSWGFYSQALTILRCTLWMDFYGKSADYDEILEKWVYAWTFGNDIMFGQELHPLTGKTSNSSEWYSSCMLLYIYAVRRLGILK